MSLQGNKPDEFWYDENSLQGDTNCEPAWGETPPDYITVLVKKVDYVALEHLKESLQVDVAILKNILSKHTELFAENDAEIADLKIALADRTEKYKLFMDKGLYEMHKKLTDANTEITRLRDALDVLYPIVKVAFFDNHTAGTLPGSGYHHRVYRLISEKFGWQDTKKWDDFSKIVLERTKGKEV